jgi:uncharacterized protein
MKLHADRPGSSHYIQRFEGGALHVAGQVLRGPVILAADRIITDWLPRPLAQLELEDFRLALDLEPELIIFGTGSTHRFPDPRLGFAIMSAGVGFEVMGTAAACRTYNVLVAEDRRVVAALLLD